jgi:hypothetical protein
MASRKRTVIANGDELGARKGAQPSSPANDESGYAKGRRFPGQAREERRAAKKTASKAKKAAEAASKSKTSSKATKKKASLAAKAASKAKRSLKRKTAKAAVESVRKKERAVEKKSAEASKHSAATEKLSLETRKAAVAAASARAGEERTVGLRQARNRASDAVASSKEAKKSASSAKKLSEQAKKIAATAKAEAKKNAKGGKPFETATAAKAADEAERLAKEAEALAAKAAEDAKRAEAAAKAARDAAKALMPTRESIEQQLVSTFERERKNRNIEKFEQHPPRIFGRTGAALYVTIPVEALVVEEMIDDIVEIGNDAAEEIRDVLNKRAADQGEFGIKLRFWTTFEILSLGHMNRDGKSPIAEFKAPGSNRPVVHNYGGHKSVKFEAYRHALRTALEVFLQEPTFIIAMFVGGRIIKPRSERRRNRRGSRRRRTTE